MLPTSNKTEYVEAALTEAVAIQQAFEDETDDEGVENEDVHDEESNGCRNPFCKNVLRNSYASYCEERPICQQYRALRLQCLANAEAAAIQDMTSLGRTDSFLVVGVSSGVDVRTISHTGTTSCESEEKENAEANTPFVIPRRKCTSTASAAGANDINENESTQLRPPARKNGSIFRAVNVDTLGSSSRKRPRGGPRMNFNEVLALFEPRTTTVPALAVSSQMRARRTQQTSRRTQTGRVARKSGVESRPLRGTRQANILAGGGRYVQSGNRSSLQSMRGLALISRPAYKPQSTLCAPTPPTLVTGRLASPRELPSRFTGTSNQPSQLASSVATWQSRRQGTTLKSRSTLGKRTREMRREYSQQRQCHNRRWLHPELPQPSQRYHQPGYERTTEVIVDLPPSHLSPSPACSNGYSDHRSDSERTNGAPFLTSCGRREDCRDAESYRNLCESDVRDCRPPYDNNGDWVNCREIHDIDNTVDRNYDIHRANRREEVRWPTSLYSTSLPIPSVGAHDNESDVNHVGLSIEQPLDRQQNGVVRVSVERPVLTSRRSRTMTPTRFRPDIEVGDTERSVSSDTDRIASQASHSTSRSSYIYCRNSSRDYRANWSP